MDGLTWGARRNGRMGAVAERMLQTSCARRLGRGKRSPLVQTQYEVVRIGSLGGFLSLLIAGIGAAILDVFCRQQGSSVVSEA